MTPEWELGGIEVATCSGCGRPSLCDAWWHALDAPKEGPFGPITREQRFRCHNCGPPPKAVP